MLRTLAFLFMVTALGVAMVACSSAENETPPSQPISETGISVKNSDVQLYEVNDSSQIVNYENGLGLYTVLEGPGPFPVDGIDVFVHYKGLLEDGKVFDSSYQRGEPLKVRMGSGKLIQGFEYSLKQLRMGSKAIAFVPPALGYGSKEDVPNIPPNSSLIFHIEVLGTF